MVGGPGRFLPELETGERAVAGDGVGLRRLHLARGGLGDLQALLEEFRLHSPGAVHAAAAVDHLHVGARPLEEIAAAIADVLHAVVTGNVHRHLADLLRRPG